ncbi:conserved hypothetical protein [Vibrio nigripulchritudo SO65]|uniref:hypothetical protein n=1 Tax=Vibrio nigripulchritudo TaxID=28173 RepID=UPI0003B1A79E|nr:hypothetical protein [Vibrio nigripulchritudo]CCN34603.1 conserved hypothetical protein [Vibrio nigripulchritudo AM115]CCN40586.1 conserved hypothetical protein [Vibrio nigripulchritudo FTn2]CCN66120.1 conserved hypothetical protein [Vibrio nigripulchritudo POn4]CCN78610.1 conserved hypothetical protein [Vibrio nigripulchritudo SO65]
MNSIISQEDKIFLQQVESCGFPISEFNHKAHIRLGYIYLAGMSLESALDRMRNSLTNLLSHNEIAPEGKYHETLTKAWLIAILCFMKKSEGCVLFDHFIEANPELLSSDLLLHHYAKATLFSDQARTQFVEPDELPFPDLS